MPRHSLANRITDAKDEKQLLALLAEANTFRNPSAKTRARWDEATKAALKRIEEKRR